MTATMKITPMLQQYLDIKHTVSDAILFYRMGDFYEMFFDDAVVASRILGIALTSRSHKDTDNKIPMCGVPYHSSASYLAKLVTAGHRVAICEQMEDPSQAKGLVKREVVRVVTPGLIIEEQLLDEKNNCYLAAIAWHGKDLGLSFVDISTGEFLITEPGDEKELLDELSRLAPAELLLPAPEDTDDPIPLEAAIIGQWSGLCITRRPAAVFQLDTAREQLLAHFRVVNLVGFGCETMKAAICAAGALLFYLHETQKANLAHIERLTPIDIGKVLIVDESSRRNLELIQTVVGAKREGSLLGTLDLTCTPMGARLMKKRLLYPLREVALINRRLDAVEQFFLDLPGRERVREILSEIYDLERLNSRVVLGSAHARDLLALKTSLGRLPELKDLLLRMPIGIIREIGEELDVGADIHNLIDEGIREDAPLTLREGGLIREGYHADLDELIHVLRDGKEMILSLEAKERGKTGINNLKVGFNRVFGYYIEVSRGQMRQVPDYFIRKQTLANGERYITPELKEFENTVLGAQERRLDLEYALFCEIRGRIAEQKSRLIAIAGHLARLDFFAALAEAAQRFRYSRPGVDNGEEIHISEGRHPVIEQTLPLGRFVPNDMHLDQNEQEVLIITGPNMAGKSTVLRQTALIVLMAQMGGFVPAKEARVGIVDRIFTRVGAMDDLARGQSTFMVEMNETANILNNATDKSLVILDEIGRGTSTFDGLSIAWAVTEELVNKNNKGVKTIFATHYHELTELALTNQRIKNYNIAVREWNDTIIFLYKLLPGGTNRSYGIQVAALAGVPGHVVTRAREILANIEKGELNQWGQPRLAGSKSRSAKKSPLQLDLFSREDDPIRKRLAEIRPDIVSPIEALTLLYELKGLIDVPTQ